MVINTERLDFFVAAVELSVAASEDEVLVMRLLRTRTRPRFTRPLLRMERDQGFSRVFWRRM